MKPSLSVIPDVNIGGTDLSAAKMISFHSITPISSLKVKKIFLLSLLPFLLRATTVVALVTRDHIVIGVDSKLTVVTNQGGRGLRTAYRTTCKVLRQASAVYVAQGPHSPPFLDVREIISSSATFRFEDSIPLVREKIRLGLKHLMPLMRANQPDYYSRFLTGLPIFSLYMGWRSGNTVAFRLLQFHLIRGGSDITVSEHIGPSPGGEVYYTIEGNEGGTDPIPDDWATQDHFKVVREGVEFGIKWHPEGSGPPIAIIEVSRSGISWHQNEKGVCNESTSNALR